MKRYISTQLIADVKEWLGDEGLAFFKQCQKDYGTVSPVIAGNPPHPVHFREGMKVRNFMRESEHCIGWSANDLDDNWIDVIVRSIE